MEPRQQLDLDGPVGHYTGHVLLSPHPETEQRSLPLIHPSVVQDSGGGGSKTLEVVVVQDSKTDGPKQTQRRQDSLSPSRTTGVKLGRTNPSHFPHDLNQTDPWDDSSTPTCKIKSLEPYSHPFQPQPPEVRFLPIPCGSRSEIPSTWVRDSVVVNPKVTHPMSRPSSSPVLTRFPGPVPPPNVDGLPYPPYRHGQTEVLRNPRIRSRGTCDSDVVSVSLTRPMSVYSDVLQSYPNHKPRSRGTYRAIIS